MKEGYDLRTAEPEDEPADLDDVREVIIELRSDLYVTLGDIYKTLQLICVLIFCILALVVAFLYKQKFWWWQ